MGYINMDLLYNSLNYKGPVQKIKYKNMLLIKQHISCSLSYFALEDLYANRLSLLKR